MTASPSSAASSTGPGTGSACRSAAVDQCPSAASSGDLTDPSEREETRARRSTRLPPPSPPTLSSQVPSAGGSRRAMIGATAPEQAGQQQRRVQQHAHHESAVRGGPFSNRANVFSSSGLSVPTNWLNTAA